VVIGLSTSGESANVVKAIQAANEKGCVTVIMTGQVKSQLSTLANTCFLVNSTETARVQEAHSFISHLICEGLDAHF